MTARKLLQIGLLSAMPALGFGTQAWGQGASAGGAGAAETAPAKPSRASAEAAAKVEAERRETAAAVGAAPAAPAEITKRTTTTTTAVPDAANLDVTFRRLDTNSDGMLSLAEFKAGGAMLVAPPAPASAERVNGPGAFTPPSATGPIDREEKVVRPAEPVRAR